MEEQIRSGKYTLPKFAQDLPVLLVDRNKSLNKIKAKLEKFSYQVTGVNLASEALSMIWESKTCYKFVVADRNLPEMDCVSFVLALRQREIPLIWMSDSYDGAKETLLDGASYVLRKPIFSNDLKPLWQFAFRRSNQKESYGAGGTSGSATRLDLLDIENKQVEKKEQVNQRDKEEGLITTTNNQQEGSKHKRLIDDQKGSMQDKRTRYNKSESIFELKERDQNDRGRRGDGNRKAKGRERPLWGPLLESKFKAAISELDPGATARAIYEKMNDPSITQKQVTSHLQKYKRSVENKNADSGATSLPFTNNSSSSSRFKNQLPAEVAATTKQLGSEQARNWVELGDGIQNPKPMVELGPAAGLPNIPHANQNQNFTTNFSATFNSNCKNQLPAGVARTTEPLGFEQANTITSGIATNSENFPTNFIYGMQNLQPIEELVPAAGSSRHPAYANQNQDVNISREAPFSTRHQSQLPGGGVTGTTELGGSVQGEITSGSATNSENFLMNFSDGIQNQEPKVELALAAGSSNQNQPPSEHADPLTIYDEGTVNCDDFFDPINPGDTEQNQQLMMEQTVGLGGIFNSQNPGDIEQNQKPMAEWPSAAGSLNDEYDFLDNEDVKRYRSEIDPLNIESRHDVFGESTDM